MSSGEKLKLGVFDINGTIHTDESGIPVEVIAGFNNLHNQGASTTVITGRSLETAAFLIGQSWSSIISPDAPLSVENGSRLISQDGDNIFHRKMSYDEKAAVVDAVGCSMESISYLAYCTENTALGSSLWLSDKTNISEFSRRHGRFGRMYSIDEFLGRLLKKQVSMIIIGGDQDAVAENLPEANLVKNGSELNVMSEGVDKSTGVLDLAEYFDVDLQEIVIGGNDLNDLEMLRLDAGKKVFVRGCVGEEKLDSLSGLEIVDDIESLGMFLQSIKVSGPVATK